MTTTIVSLMICQEPRRFGNYTILSAYHGVWEAVRNIPADIAQYVTDDVGNEDVDYGGRLQIKDTRVLSLVQDHGFYACFRAVLQDKIVTVDTVPPVELLRHLKNHLISVGWDVCTGNGWRSASCEGDFPIDPFDGSIDNATIGLLNRWALLTNLDHALEFCNIANLSMADYAPWYPVEIYLDVSSHRRLSENV